MMLQSKLHGLTDTLVICVGDCGFGFDSIKNIILMREKQWDNFLENRNLYVIFIRGNHDNPEWFNPTSFINKNLNTERFCLIPDYTVIEWNDKKILCVGGGVSIDKNKRIYGKTMWHGEEMQIKGRLLPDENIDILVTHVVDINMLTIPIRRISIDEQIDLELKSESELARSLYFIYKPKIWCHGHYHQSGVSQFQETMIRSLACDELYEIK
jgi:calcineurin-like phosphoesterase family protein